MAAQGLTVTELSARSKIKRAYVSHLVTGKRKNPSQVYINRLAKALGQDPETIFLCFFYGR